jgi:hypothetical protein
MKRGCAPCCLEAIAGHYFKRALSQHRAIGREQEVTVSLRQIEGGNEQFLKITFNLKRLSSGRSRKGRWIENDCVKFLSLARKSRQHRHYIVRDEAMTAGWQAV